MPIAVKPWFKSRTIWVNVLSLIAFVVQMQFGFILSPEVQAAILVLLNIILRFDTNTGISAL